MLDIENLGLLGVFIAGAIPWMEAIAVVPAGILVGLDPIATVIAASLGNAITIFLFAYFASNIRARLINRIYGLAVLGPMLIGTQFAAAAAVSAGVKPLRSSILITVSMFLWAIVIAVAVVALDIKI